MQFTHSIAKLPKETYEITVKIPWAEIQKAYDKAFTGLSEELEVEGFRKGKAPKAIAEKHIRAEHIYDRAIRDLLPSIYEEIVTKEGLRPVVNPKIDLKEAKQNEEWTVVFTIAQKPDVKLGDYKKIAEDVRKKHKKADIWVPGADKPASANAPADEQDKAREQQLMLNDILNELLKSSSVEIAEVIVEEEMNNRLARLVDDVQKLGMTVDSYLKSKQITMEELKAQYFREIEETHKIELILNEIAEKEGIQVEEEELNKLFGSVKDERERETAKKNAYFYAMILRKQKTLDFLLGV